MRTVRLFNISRLNGFLISVYWLRFTNYFAIPLLFLFSFSVVSLVGATRGYTLLHTHLLVPPPCGLALSLVVFRTEPFQWGPYLGTVRASSCAPAANGYNVVTHSSTDQSMLAACADLLSGALTTCRLVAPGVLLLFVDDCLGDLAVENADQEIVAQFEQAELPLCKLGELNGPAERDWNSIIERFGAR